MLKSGPVTGRPTNMSTVASRHAEAPLLPAPYEHIRPLHVRTRIAMLAAAALALAGGLISGAAERLPSQTIKLGRAAPDGPNGTSTSNENSTPGEEPKAVPKPPDSSRTPKALFNVDIDKLSDIPVKPSASARSNDVPSSYVSTEDSSHRNAATTGELLEKAGSVNLRRTSAINLDALVRGYNSQQTVAVANGMNQLKTRVDIDSLFSQVDPGIVQDITVIDGPYSSLYGPGVAFLVADLNQSQRYDDDFQGHASLASSYGTNDGALDTRANAWGGGLDHSVYVR